MSSCVIRFGNDGAAGESRLDHCTQTCHPILLLEQIEKFPSTPTSLPRQVDGIDCIET
jgi:hypothetical protein